MCRFWAADMAAPEAFGGAPAQVLSGVVSDPAARTSHELDVVVFDSAGAVLSIGEVKWNDVVGMSHLRRLEEVATLLEKQGRRPGVLCLFSGAGFMPELTKAAAKSGGRIQLVDLERLYQGE